MPYQPQPGDIFYYTEEPAIGQAFWLVLDEALNCETIWCGAAWNQAIGAQATAQDWKKGHYRKVEGEDLEALCRLDPAAAARRLGWL
jgi:hypothetical protein